MNLTELVALYGPCVCKGDFCADDGTVPSDKWECMLCGHLSPERNCPADRESFTVVAYRPGTGRVVMDDDVCAYHGVSEPLRPGDYKVCGECWHVWRTEAEFRRDVTKTLYWMNNVPESWGRPDPPAVCPDNLDQVYSCPLCSHDF